MTDYVIGVDLGTGSTKALAINFRGQVIASAQVHYQTQTPSPGFCEQAPELVWQAFIKCIQRLLATRESPPAAIILSSAMHSIMPVDRNGTALGNMMIWADNRSAAIAQKIKQSAAGEMIYEQTGTPIHAMSPLCKIIWMKENQPAIFQTAAKFISIKEYVWFKIFHNFEVDHSIASASGLFDIEQLAWNENALALCELGVDKLSKPVGTNHRRTDAGKEICRMMGISPDTLFVVGASDGCLANLGSFAIAPGTAALTIGTSGAVRVASKTPIHNFAAMTFNYLLDENTFICGGPSNNGGVVLKWYVESFLGKTLATSEDYTEILKSLADTKPGAEGLIFLPYLFGERAPLWNSDSCGVFFGIRSGHTQAHFTRAVIEGISMALYDIADNMIKGGSEIKQIHVSGGFVRSSHWLQVLADIFNKKICLINSDDASALGAGYLGLKAMNLISDYQTLKPDTIREVYPQKKFIETYQKKFQLYRDLYTRLKDTMLFQNS
jgi:gluconokinase